MAKTKHEFTLFLSGARKLTEKKLDALFEAGCDDALFGVSDGAVFADFCRKAETYTAAVVSAISAVEGAGVGLRVKRVEPDDGGPLNDALSLRGHFDGDAEAVAFVRDLFAKSNTTPVNAIKNGH